MVCIVIFAIRLKRKKEEKKKGRKFQVVFLGQKRRERRFNRKVGKSEKHPPLEKNLWGKFFARLRVSTIERL